MRRAPAPEARSRRWLGSPAAARASVAAVVLLALLYRLFKAWHFNRRHPNGPERLVYGDEPSYNQVALDLLQGLGFPSPARLPLYPSWVALLHWFSGENYDVVPYAQAFLGALTVLLTYLLGRRLAGHAPALLAALLAAGSYVLVRQSQHMLSEVMFTPAVLLVALALEAACRQPSVRRFALAGVAVGMANLVRPTLLFFPPFVALALVGLGRDRRALRHAGVYVLAAWLTTAPWTLHNYVRHGAFIPLATSNATLWLGSPEYYHLVRDEGYTYHRVWDEIIYPDDPAVPYPVTVEGERYWNERAWRSIRAEPLTYARFALEKLGTYWVGDPNADWADTHVFNYAALRGWGYPPRDALQLMVARALPILALLALLVLLPRWRALLPVLLLLGYSTLLHAATVARARMSEPLQPFLLILIAAAALHLAGGRLGRRRQRHGEPGPHPAADGNAHPLCEPAAPRPRVGTTAAAAAVPPDPPAPAHG